MNSNPKIVIGIPARLGATRLPGKPMRQILNCTLIEHVYNRSKMSKVASDVFIAACDVSLQSFMTQKGANVIMTDANIRRPALRVAAAIEALNLKPDDVIVIVQGDEPLVHPDMIDACIKDYLNTPEALCGCMMAKCSEEEWHDPNEIKVVFDRKGRALFMSRSPIPSQFHQEDKFRAPRMKQVCIFPFRVKHLRTFLMLEESPFEMGESIELLRALEHGYVVKMTTTDYITKSVDTEEDLKRVTEMMKIDELYPIYGNTKA